MWCPAGYLWCIVDFLLQLHVYELIIDVHKLIGQPVEAAERESNAIAPDN